MSTILCWITTFILVLLGVSRATKGQQRQLLDTLTPSIVVDQNGSPGSILTIGEAIVRAPNNSQPPFLIQVKAKRYVEENLIVGKEKTNLWFWGDGKGKTIISGNKSVNISKIDTKQTATFSALGNGLFLQNLTIKNEAGPEGHQAVALYVEAHRVVVYNCELDGFQDTLWVAQGRQFYRNCDIYGTVDFIFGDAAAVFQRCHIWAHRPIKGQENVITAQGRENRDDQSGIVIHGCTIGPAADLVPVKSTTQTYLGSPWKTFSRVVYMDTEYGDLVDPSGWAKWNDTAPIQDLYYGEFSNTGPSSKIENRVKWPSVHSNMDKAEAQKFTVAHCIQGPTWINTTTVPFQAGLFT